MGVPTASNLMLMGAAPDLGKQRYVHLSAEVRGWRDACTTTHINYVDEQFADAFLTRNTDRAEKYRIEMNGPIWGLIAQDTHEQIRIMAQCKHSARTSAMRTWPNGYQQPYKKALPQIRSKKSRGDAKNDMAG